MASEQVARRRVARFLDLYDANKQGVVDALNRCGNNPSVKVNELPKWLPKRLDAAEGIVKALACRTEDLQQYFVDEYMWYARGRSIDEEQIAGLSVDTLLKDAAQLDGTALYTVVANYWGKVSRSE